MAILFHDFPEPADKGAVRLDSLVGGDRFEQGQRNLRRSAHHGFQLGSSEQGEQRQRHDLTEPLADGPYLRVEFVEPKMQGQLEVEIAIVAGDAPVRVR